MIDFNKLSDKTFNIIKNIIILALLVLVFFIIRGYLIKKWDKEEIIENKAFVKGNIVEYGHSGISYHYVKYSYKVGGQYIENRHGITLLPCATITDFSDCLGLEYWVIYSKLNPEKSYLLATSFEYELFDLKVPEEMK
ncbi:MAG TPA: hypothetical protein PK649_07875 [Vicingus sp.]|nr:hypothetical protein [Vicingus sp.]